MNKEQALERLAIIEKETAELKAIINNSGKPSAKEWLIDFLNKNAKNWRVTIKKDWHIWHIGEDWIFDVDLKNKDFWCSFQNFWRIFSEEYKMSYTETQNLIKDVMLKQFNYEGFTPFINKIYL